MRASVACDGQVSDNPRLFLPLATSGVRATREGPRAQHCTQAAPQIVDGDLQRPGTDRAALVIEHADQLTTPSRRCAPA